MIGKSCVVLVSSVSNTSMAAGCVGWVALVHGISFLFEGGEGRLVEVPLGVSS